PRPLDRGRTIRPDEVRPNQSMASRTTAGANVRPPQPAVSFYRVSSWSLKRTSHPEGTNSAPQFNNPEQMPVRDLNAAWVALPPKASCIDGLSVPHTGAILAERNFQ